MSNSLQLYVTNAIIAFCDYLEKKGFYVGIYSSLSWFKNQIDTKRLEKYTKWVACWSALKPHFDYNGFDMWQNSDNGYISGYRVDTDEAYKDFTSVIKTKGYNGYTKTEKAPKTENNKPKTSKEPIVYVVKKGDTLSAIAKKYKTTVAKLVKDNNIKDKNKIYVGDKIKINV